MLGIITPEQAEAAAAGRPIPGKALGTPGQPDQPAPRPRAGGYIRSSTTGQACQLVDPFTMSRIVNGA